MTRIIALFAMLAVLFTSHGVGFARAQAPAVGQVVLCIGMIPTLTYIDEDGAPTATPQLCPDCIAGFAADLSGSFAIARPEAFLSGERQCSEASKLASNPLAWVQARAPPV